MSKKNRLTTQLIFEGELVKHCLRFSLYCLGIILFSSSSNVLSAQISQVEFDELPIPVTDKPINNRSDVFRFAIMSDRTGGMQAGVFKDAAQKVNWLQPEFVLSVGDLIDGYTKSPNVWETQWSEFDEIVNQMAMPFYYVPGNHDTSNEILTQVWRQRHGKDYYTFTYKKVLFVVINTDEIEGGGISKQQSDYLVQAIKEADHIRWVMVFMHRPVWSYGDDMGYSPIEDALQGMNYTVFSGHHHHYRYALKNGQEHFTLATTGGGSYLRGVELGEFNHITWVTMKETGPEVAHIGIDKIYPKDVLPIKDYDDIQLLRQGSFFELQDLDLTAKDQQKIKGNIKFKNELTHELELKGDFPQDSRFRFIPSKLDLKVPAGENFLVPYEITLLGLDDSLSVDNYNQFPIGLDIKASFRRSDQKKVTANSYKPFIWRQLHSMGKTSQNIRVDGQAQEWSTLRYELRNPLYIKEDWDWSGVDDGLLSFDLTTNNEGLYLFLEFKDDVLIQYEDSLNTLQDKFLIHAQAFDNSAKQIFTTNDPIEYFQTTEGSDISSANYDLAQEFALKIEENLYQLEIKYPINPEILSTISTWKINVGFMDHDRIENTKPSVLWWRPIIQTDLPLTGYGIFSN